jgi:hypothetical protein
MQFQIIHAILNKLTKRKSFDKRHDECSAKEKLKILGAGLGNTSRKSLKHFAQETAVSKLSA